MARDKATLSNIDKSNLPDYPNGRIKDNTGAGDGTPVNERVYGDFHEVFAKLMRLAGLVYNGLPDNETNGYQLLDALVALASKNDYVLNIGSAGGKLTIPIKLGTLQTNESFICMATVNKGSETVIKSTLDNTQKSVDFTGSFKTGEYVRLINTGTNIKLIRLVDSVNLNTAVAENNFLKAATTAEDKAGALNNVATTPLGNILAFAEWVNGTASASSLATALRNGLYPKEHYNIVANIGDSPIKNKGWVSGLDPGGGSSGNTYPVYGDFTQCAFYSKNDGATTWTVTMANAMDNVNYYVKIFLQSQGNIDHDDDCFAPIFVPVSTTQFRIRIDESNNKTQNFKIHMEVEQIS